MPKTLEVVQCSLCRNWYEEDETRPTGRPGEVECVECLDNAEGSWGF